MTTKNTALFVTGLWIYVAAYGALCVVCKPKALIMALSVTSCLSSFGLLWNVIKQKDRREHISSILEKNKNEK